MKALIDSKELAVGAWVRTDGEIARITSLYKHNGELVAEGKLYDIQVESSQSPLRHYCSKRMAG